MSEPTRYTRCWHCNREFPLREIRAHGAWCRNREQSTTFPRIEPGALKADWRDDVFTMTVDTSAIQQQMAEALREADDKIAEPVVVEWLRKRGWLVEKCDGGCSPFDGPAEECSLHGRPVSEVWEALSQRTGELEAERARTAKAIDLLREFADDDPCRLDHHGGCQTHGFLEPGPDERCHVERAREFISGGVDRG